ncbi:MAG: ArsR family transcriptional regulator [Clostridiales bacterium]|jgi:ArsR family transcriptional regulator|nr:ArsR family transcriptional regulator [Clostridiales bacterium]
MDIETISKNAAEQFAVCRKLLVALGDETRQAVITTLISAKCDGMRVGDITERTHLSRPAVSHHLQILLDTEVIGVTHEGTKNYYWLKLGGAWEAFVALINNIQLLRESGGTCDECD